MPKQSKAQAGGPQSTFALHDCTETSRRADNDELLNALPSLSIDRKTILEALGMAALSGDGGDRCLGGATGRAASRPPIAARQVAV